MSTTMEATPPTVTDENANAPNSPEPQKKLITLDVLHTIKSAQSQNGLRHGNYQRYRKYCAHKIARLRRQEGVGHGKRFTKRKFTAESVSSARSLMLPLFQAERAWSYAMQIKEEAPEDSTRPKYHVLRRLAKAARWGDLLFDLCSNSPTDDRTTLEAQAYASWMNANVLLQREEWAQALERFAKARTIYSELAKVAELEQHEEFRQRVEEIDPAIRYCNFNIGGQTNSSDIQSLISHTQGPGLDLLNAKLESVLEETRKKQAGSMGEIKWRGKVIPIKSDKLQVALYKAQEATMELDRADEIDGKLELYTKLFICHSEALQETRSELKQIASKSQGEKKATKVEIQEQNLIFIQKYINYLKLTRTIERNLLLAENSRVKGRLELNQGGERRKAKPCKPEELVRLYETILENLADLHELRNEEDIEQEKEIAARILSFKAFRCFYVAISYSLAGKWAEAYALLDRCQSQLNIARDHHMNRATAADSDLKRLETLNSYIQSERCVVTASAFLESNTPTTEQTTSSSSSQSVGNTLYDSTNVWTTQFAETGKLVDFPPDISAAYCKPILFDIALLECEFPSLEHKMTQKKSGGFWGFWRS